MSQKHINQANTKRNSLKTVEVALGVIYYKEHYLLGYRHAGQHQGERYEFIGGKIEASEQPQQALVREIEEEIGLRLNQNQVIESLGIVQHDYQQLSDKPSLTDASFEMSNVNTVHVRLHVYKVGLTLEQYTALKQQTHGCENQALTWVSKQALLDNQYALPEANQTILKWL